MPNPEAESIPQQIGVQDIAYFVGEAFLLAQVRQQIQRFFQWAENVPDNFPAAEQKALLTFMHVAILKTMKSYWSRRQQLLDQLPLIAKELQSSVAESAESQLSQSHSFAPSSSEIQSLAAKIASQINLRPMPLETSSQPRLPSSIAPSQSLSSLSTEDISRLFQEDEASSQAKMSFSLEGLVTQKKIQPFNREELRKIQSTNPIKPSSK